MTKSEDSDSSRDHDPSDGQLKNSWHRPVEQRRLAEEASDHQVTEGGLLDVTMEDPSHRNTRDDIYTDPEEELSAEVHQEALRALRTESNGIQSGEEEIGALEPHSVDFFAISNLYKPVMTERPSQPAAMEEELSMLRFGSARQPTKQPDPNPNAFDFQNQEPPSPVQPAGQLEEQMPSISLSVPKERFDETTIEPLSFLKTVSETVTDPTRLEISPFVPVFVPTRELVPHELQWPRRGEEPFKALISLISREPSGRFRKVVYYSLRGSFEQPNDLTSANVFRRYNDFVFLQSLISQSFYYYVLPVLPEKSLLLKLKNSTAGLELRARGLELYLLKLLEIPELALFEPLRLFLLNQAEFELLEKKARQAPSRERLLDRLPERLRQAVNLLSRDDAPSDPGCYAIYAKEVDSLLFFIQSCLSNFQALDECMKKIYRNMSHLVEVSLKINAKRDIERLREGSELTSSKLESIQVGIRKDLLEKLVQALGRLSSDVRGCKEALERKDEIYKLYHRLQAESSLGGNSPSEALLKSRELEELRGKVERLSSFFKPDLERHLKLVNIQLDEIFNGNLRHILLDLYRLN